MPDSSPLGTGADILDDTALAQLFTEARTHAAWTDRPVPDDLLRRLYDLARWAPTSMNTCPMRLVFVRTPEGKARLREALAPGNVEKTMAAPATAIVAHDAAFYEELPTLFPHNPNARETMAGNAELAEVTAFRNGTLQGGYLILAARALGLDCGPMSGFDNAKLDALFFEGTPWRSNFLVNLGYGDREKLKPRKPRLDFDTACRWA